MPITLIENPDARTWQLEVSDDTGNLVEVSREYTTKYGAVKAGRYYELYGRLPTKVRPGYEGQDTTKASAARRKFSEDDIRAIRASEEASSVLVERYGVAKSTISMIRTGRHYSWVKG